MKDPKTLQEALDLIKSMKMCGICKYFMHDSDFHEGDDEWLSTYCDLKDKNAGYWSSGVCSDGTCDDWEMVR